MATIYVGSARHDENGNYTGGSAGDQLQKSSTNDLVGEVSQQTMYTHSKGWYILRPKSVSYANKLAAAMITLCNNAYVGYDQNNRLGIITYGINTTTKTECDCGSAVRACIINAMGTDPGNFTTASEKEKLLATGLFEDKGSYTSQSKTPVYNGDVLVTQTKGHTVIVTSGNARSSSTTYTLDKAQAKSSSYNHTYTTTAALNLRAGAGTNKSIITTMAKGSSFRCYGYYTTKDGVAWLYGTYGSYTGFCSVKYLKKSS